MRFYSFTPSPISGLAALPAGVSMKEPTWPHKTGAQHRQLHVTPSSRAAFQEGLEVILVQKGRQDRAERCSKGVIY